MSSAATQMGIKRFQRRARPEKNDLYEFQHDKRVAFLMGPCIVLMMVMGGKVYSGIIVIGLMLTYLLDSVTLKEGAFGLFWLSVLGAVVSISLVGADLGRSTIGTLFLLLNLTSYTFLMAVWTSLHMPHFTTNFPDLALKFEQVLFSAICMPSTCILMIGVVSVTGSDNAPYYLVPVLFYAYKITMTPIAPSNHKSHHVTAKQQMRFGPHIKVRTRIDEYVVSSLVATVHTLLFVFLPALYYVSIHHRSLCTSLGITNLLLLLCFPLLLLMSMVGDDVLWWLGIAPDTAERALRSRVLGLVMFILTGCLEYRIVLYSFSSYLFFHSTQPGLSTLLVTICLYSALFVLLIALQDWRQGKTGTNAIDRGIGGSGHKSPAQAARRSRRQFLLRILAQASTISGGAAIGLPLHLFPFVMIAAHMGTVIYFSQKLSYYLLFVAAASIGFAWFLHRTFWFLRFQVSTGLSLQTLCVFLLVLFLLALLIPGISFFGKPSMGRVGVRRIIGVLLAGYTFLLTWVEFAIFNQNSHFSTQMYGFYLVIFTSALGIYLARHLEGAGMLSPFFNWVLFSMNVGKLSILFHASSMVSIISALVLAGTLSSMYLLYHPNASRLDGAANDVHQPHSYQHAKSTSMYGMTSVAGLVHATLNLVVLFVCRYTLYPTIISQFFEIDVSDSLTMSIFIGAGALSMLPLSFHHFHHITGIRRSNTVAIAIAALYLLIQPNFGGASDGPLANLVTIDGSGSMSGMDPSWPSWLLFFALCLLVISVTVVLPMPRILFALVIGTCLALYICGLFVPYSMVLYGLYICVFDLVALFLVYLYWRTSMTNTVLTYSYGAFVALLFSSELVIRQLFRYAPRRQSDHQNLFKIAQVTTLSVYVVLNFLIALCVKMSREVSLNDEAPSAMNAGLGGVVHMRSGGGGPSSRVFGGELRRATHIKTIEIPVEVSIGNLATILTVGLGLLLNLYFLQGSVTSVLFLAPILLLLNQDGGMFKGLTEERRYFPIVAATSIFLLVSAGFWVFLLPLCKFLSLVARDPGEILSLWEIGQETVWLCCVVPTQIQFLTYLWEVSRTSDFMLLTLAPLNVLALVLSSRPEVPILAVVGLIGSGFRFYTAHSIRQHGMKVI